ncbi:protein transport protein Sec24C-like [Uloborus diversus]|uniref:protein transport protein Sec24C-like n=1 Tax=Uloborus diversus TaxID=327109 RepID=UPI00240A39EA|nr:protein transport protein Sec24C-like [Uloborus diversus]
MNSQYGSSGPYMPPYAQPPPPNAYNAFGMQSEPAPNKSMSATAYGYSGVHNGPSNVLPGQRPNPNAFQVPSASVPASSQVNQLSNEMNAMHLSQNQNHLLVTGHHSNHRLPNNLSEPPSSLSPNSTGHQQYWQQSSRLPHNPEGAFNQPPSNANYLPSSTVEHPYSVPPPPQGTSFPPNMQQNERTISPAPPLGDQVNQPHFGRPNQAMPNQEMYPPSVQQRQYPMSRPPMPYTNGTSGPTPPGSHYGQHGSSMHARYPPASISPSPSQSAPQYPQPGNIGATSNRLGSLPQPSGQRRLDPDNMPSPIQVIEDDRKLRSCSFSTAQRGLVPPLVTTDFSVIDEGICSPRFMRSTIYNVPTTAEMLKQTSVPFAIAVSPFARLHKDEYPPPIVDPGEEGPVRCHRCRAYMSPFMQFIDAGRRFQCMLCKATTEVPAYYFTHLDHMGERVDKMERPELCLGSYEFIVNRDYCKEGKFPNCPAFIFLIDVSYNNIRNGMVKTLCDNMKYVLAGLPREHNAESSKIRVGFITYSSVIHFFNINSNLAQPQMLVVSDVNDMFMPLLDGFLVEISEAEHVINSLVEQIPTIFADSRETETVLGPAIQAGLEALKAAECAGKLFVFHSTLPIAEAPGKLKSRDDRKLLGTEKEKTILNPQTSFYNNLGQECVKAGCSIDLFLFNNAYIDVATLGQVCRLTGGHLYKYTYFQSDIDGMRFIEDLRRNIEKPIAFDAVLRIRTSTGVRPTDFSGCFFMSNTTDVELASVNCDNSLAIEIKYDDKLTEEEGVCIQCAVLYTSCSGQRRLRVHNLALNTCSQMAELFRHCELDTMMNVFLKEGIRRILDESPKQVKDYFISRSAQILACYRKNCAQASSAGQLILPECMKLLPLYINCLIKCDALAGGQEMSTDDRSFIMVGALNMDVDSSAAYLYPRLLPLHEIVLNNSESIPIQLPTAIRCSVERLKEHGIYLLENGLTMFLWVGLNADPEWVQDVFGVPTVVRVDVEKNHLLELNNPLSLHIRNILKQIQSERQRTMRLYIVRQGEKLELLFRQLLVEDRTTEGSASYVDFLCHLHKEIRTLLS